MKRAEQVLDSRMVDGNLSTYGSIDLRQLRCGHLNNITAARIHSCNQPSQIATSATPKGHDERSALKVRFDTTIQQPARTVPIFFLLPFRKRHQRRQKTGTLQRFSDSGTVQFSNLVIAHDKAPTAQPDLFAFWADLID